MTKELVYKVPLVFEPQPEGGYTVTCPLLPELITEGDTIGEVLANVEDALIAIVEAYEDLNRPFRVPTGDFALARDAMDNYVAVLRSTS
jgi:antitoxin HicB